MQLVVFSDHRYQIDSDGNVCSPTGLGDAFLKRYLRVFESIRVVSRMESVRGTGNHDNVVASERIQFSPVPFWQGGRQLALQYRSLRKEVESHIRPPNGHRAYLIRMPSTVGRIAGARCQTLGVPFGMEIVGDPRTVFAWGRPAGPIGLILRQVLSRNQRTLASQSIAVGYVPSHELVQNYPSKRAHISRMYSSIALHEDAFSSGPRVWRRRPNPIRVVSISSLSFPYKGIDVLLQAIRLLVDKGHRVQATIIGDGKLKPLLQTEAHNLQLSRIVLFRGHVPAGQPLRQLLDEADVFVLPSLTEGLPRAMIEAMARGLPCIATRVGGIPEMLDAEFHAVPGSPIDFAQKLEALVSSPHRMSWASANNWVQARNYSLPNTEQAAIPVYNAIRSASGVVHVDPFPKS